MMHVEFAQEKGVMCLSVTGHAGTAPEGEDLVCAAASILVYTAKYGMEEMAKKGKMDGETLAELNPGDCLLLCKPKAEHLEEARNMFGTVLYGYHALQLSYPAAVSVNIDDEEEKDGT